MSKGKSLNIGLGATFFFIFGSILTIVVFGGVTILEFRSGCKPIPGKIDTDCNVGKFVFPLTSFLSFVLLLLLFNKRKPDFGRASSGRKMSSLEKLIGTLILYPIIHFVFTTIPNMVFILSGFLVGSSFAVLFFFLFHLPGIILSHKESRAFPGFINDPKSKHHQFLALPETTKRKGTKWVFLFLPIILGLFWLWNRFRQTD